MLLHFLYLIASLCISRNMQLKLLLAWVANIFVLHLLLDGIR